jgi:hypothetical protein
MSVGKAICISNNSVLSGRKPDRVKRYMMQRLLKREGADGVWSLGFITMLVRVNLWPSKVRCWEIRMTTLRTNQGTILRSHMLMFLPESTPKRTPINRFDKVTSKNQVLVVLHSSQVQLNLVFKFRRFYNYQRLAWAISICTSTVRIFNTTANISSLLKKSLCVVNLNKV